MIRVTIDLISAVTHKTSTIGTMYIANDGAGTPDRGDYKVAVCRRGTEDVPRELFDPGEAYALKQPRATRAGTVKDYPRLAYNVWRLIARACVAAFPEERKPAKGIAPVLDESVMRGLQILSASGIISDHEDVVAAHTWLDASNHD